MLGSSSAALCNVRQAAEYNLRLVAGERGVGQEKNMSSTPVAKGNSVARHRTRVRCRMRLHLIDECILCAMEGMNAWTPGT